MGKQNETTSLATTEQPAPLAVETATAQAEALARSEVEARYVMALRRPRDDDAVRQRLLKECSRPNFAAVALYKMPRAGRQITGPSIRFAEAARRICGNMATTVQTIFEDDEKQIVQVTAVDFETNAIDIEEAVVPKFVEKRNPKRGDEVVGSRQNSTGQTVYKVRSTDDDHRMKRRSETQRAKRNGILALLPGDLVDECKATIQKTAHTEAAADPDAYRKRICDSFASINVPVDELRKYLQHDIGQASPAELAELGAVYQTIKDGEGSWAECLAARTGIEGDGEEDPHKDLKSKIAARAREGTKKRTAKASGKGKPKAKASAPSSDDEDIKRKIAAGLTDEEIAQGFEVDPQTGEKIPPAGSEG